jgi:predicted regulator of Ras-like GTPase activity (Roadblock/LC7/MglB family)
VATREHWWQGINLGVAVLAVLVSTAVSLFIVGLSSDASREQAQLDRRQAAYADLVATSSKCASDSRYAALRQAVESVVTQDNDGQPTSDRLEAMWASTFGVRSDCQGDMDGAVARMMIDGAPAYVLIAADQLVRLTAIEIDTNTSDGLRGAGASNLVDEIGGATTTTTTATSEDSAEVPPSLGDARLKFIASAQVDQPRSTIEVWRDRLPRVLMVVALLGAVGFLVWATRRDKAASTVDR